jgi:hypothetical protein
MTLQIASDFRQKTGPAFALADPSLDQTGGRDIVADLARDRIISVLRIPGAHWNERSIGT